MAKRTSDVRVVQPDKFAANGESFKGRAGALKWIKANAPTGERFAIVKVIALVDVDEEATPTRVVREVGPEQGA